MKRIFLFLVAAMFATALSAAEYKYNRDIVYRADDDYASTMCRMDIASPEGVTREMVMDVENAFTSGSLTPPASKILVAVSSARMVSPPLERMIIPASIAVLARMYSLSVFFIFPL